MGAVFLGAVFLGAVFLGAVFLGSVFLGSVLGFFALEEVDELVRLRFWLSTSSCLILLLLNASMYAWEVGYDDFVPLILRALRHCLMVGFFLGAILGAFLFDLGGMVVSGRWTGGGAALLRSVPQYGTND